VATKKGGALTLSRRELVKLAIGVPIFGVGVVAYSATGKRERAAFDSDPCVVAHFFTFSREATVGSEVTVSALVINRSREERECVVDLIVNDYVVSTARSLIPPLDFAYVNLSFKPDREGLYVLDVAGFQDVVTARAPPPKPPQAELPEDLRKKFESLVPGVASFEQLTVGDKLVYKGYDAAGKLLGYFFQTQAQGPTDRLLVTAAISPEFRVVAIDVEPAPGSDHLFNPDIATPKFEDQFKGLSADELALKPEGKIDAVTMATYSSRAVVEAVRAYVTAISQSRQ